MLVWRGMGIAIPIIFVLSGLIYTWISGDSDLTLGNTTGMGWASLVTGILSLLLGLVAFGDDKDAQGNPVPKKKHDLFWIPMWIWGIVLVGASIYLLAFAGKKEDAADSTASNTTETAPPEPKAATRIIHFFNPGDDSLQFMVADGPKDEVILDDDIAPNTVATRKVDEGYYLMSASNTAGELVMRLPLDEENVDEKLYKKYPNEDGSAYYQRLVKPSTPEPDDYDEAWMILDGETKLLLVNVTSACDSDVTRGSILKTKWSDNIEAEYGPGDLIEPLAGVRLKEGNIKVYGPADDLPFQAEKGDVSYMLVPYQGQKDKTKLIAGQVEAACFKD